MASYRSAPPPALRGLIRAFTYWEGGEPTTELLDVMASRTPSLQIDLHDDELRWYSGTGPSGCHVLRGVTLSGTQTRPFAIDAWQPRIVRVIFEPGGTVAFFGVSPAELRDSHIPLVDVWRPAEQLRDRLSRATGPANIFRVLSQALMAGATRDRSIRPVTAWALAVAQRLPSGLRVADLARHVDATPKRLIRLFTDDVGLTPKRYLRMVRFERLLSDVYTRPGVDWARAAAEHGYFDQAHLIREFRAFAGMTPEAYLSRRGPAEHHAASAIGHQGHI